MRGRFREGLWRRASDADRFLGAVGSQVAECPVYGGRYFRAACDPGAIGGSRSFVPSVVLRNC